MVKNIFRSHPDSNYSPTSIYHHILVSLPLVLQMKYSCYYPKSLPSSDVPNPMSSPLFKDSSKIFFSPSFYFFPLSISISIQSFDYFSHLKEDTLILVSPLNNAPFICSPSVKLFENCSYTLLCPIPFKPTLTLTLTPTLTPSIPLKVLKVINDRYVINFSGQFLVP